MSDKHLNFFNFPTDTGLPNVVAFESDQSEEDFKMYLKKVTIECVDNDIIYGIWNNKKYIYIIIYNRFQSTECIKGVHYDLQK